MYIDFLNSANQVDTPPGTFFTSTNPRCDPEDVALSGGFTRNNFLTSETVTMENNKLGFVGWRIVLKSSTNYEPFRSSILCFDNPPLRP